MSFCMARLGVAGQGAAGQGGAWLGRARAVFSGERATALQCK